MLRVTQVLRLAGLVDFSGIPPAVLEAARQRGTAVHQYIDGMLRGLLGPEDADSNLGPYLAAWEHAIAGLGLEIEAHEVEVQNISHGYCGRLDLLAKIGAEDWLLDVKTSREVHPSTALQTIAYALALSPPRRVKRGAIHLRGDGTWSLVPFANDRDDRYDWLACLRVAAWRVRHKMED